MSQPNILFLFPDQHRPDWLGVNPELPLRTPNLDRICERGVRFINCLTPSPLCAPARAALAAGKSYDRCGVVDNGQPYPLDQPTVYQALQNAGYRVAGCGKFDLDKPNLEWGLDGSRHVKDWGFTEGVDNEGKFDGSISYKRNGKPVGPYLKALDDAGIAAAYCAEHARIGENMGAYTTIIPDELYCDNWLSEKGLNFLRSFPEGQPWFIQVNFTGPHNPMDVTERMRERWENVDFPGPHASTQNDDPEGHLRNRQNYAAMIENIDRQIGRFLDAVEERGELANTLVVFASDHGEMLGDHDGWGKGSWRFHSSGVPLIIAGPGVRQGVVSDAVVSIHDLAATFVDIAAAAPMPDMDAVSLCPHLRGETDQIRDCVVAGLRDWRLAYDGRYKLVELPDAEPQLYDRQTDPWEDEDVAKQNPEIVEHLHEKIEAERRQE